jgi:hypothetical protein
MLENLEGRKVVFTLQQPGLQDPQIRPHVAILDEPTVTIIARVEKVDELGVWIENSDYPYPSAGKRMPDRHRAFILIRYDFITAIAYFPDLPVDKFEDDKIIGFIDTSDYKK